MKGETTLMAMLIGTLGAITLFIGAGSYFSNLLTTYNQPVEQSFSYTSSFNDTFANVNKTAQSFIVNNPKTDPTAIFTLIPLFIFQFANLMYQLPGIMIALLNNINGTLGVYAIPWWLVAFIVSGIGIFVIYKIVSIIFQRLGDT